MTIENDEFYFVKKQILSIAIQFPDHFLVFSYEFHRPQIAGPRNLFFVFFSDDAVSILRKSSPGSGDMRMMNIDLMLKITTQNCMEKLAADRQPRTRRLGAAGKSYVITPEVWLILKKS